MIEYTEYAQGIPTWTKSNIYLGERQIATTTPNGTNPEIIEYNHPDRLGTRLITNQSTGSVTEQNIENDNFFAKRGNLGFI